MEQSPQFTPEQVKDFLEAQVKQSRSELKELMKSLKHGQKERLILAIAEYPQHEEDFSNEQVEMIKAFSAMKRCFDTNVAYGVEDVLQTMQEEQLAAMKAAQQKEV